jgi:beta-lactamase class A
MNRKSFIKFIAIIVVSIAFLCSPQPVQAEDEAQAQTEEVKAEMRHIPWSFYVYVEPDFQAERITNFRFNPQYVRTIQSNDSGWVMISTDFGNAWVYPRANRRFVNRITGIYEQPGDVNPICAINPQVVTVLEQEGNWVLINTWLGAKWLNLDFAPPTNEPDNLLRRFGYNLSVKYENLETGFTHRYNPDRVYFSASVPKAFYALYIYQKAERGEINLDSMLAYTPEDYAGGAGVIRHRYSFGADITQRELIRLNISESDNVATRMLVRHHGTEGYRRFVADIGGNPYFVGSQVSNSYLTADEAALFAREIHRYIESGSTYSEEFKLHLLNSRDTYIVSDYPVASKNGWMSPLAWHDMAIVYAPSPYILVILSEREGGTWQDYWDFSEISMAFQRFNDLWFAG